MFCTGHTELSHHMCIYYSAAVAVTCKKDVGMGRYVCLTLCYMSSPLPLHTAMPTYIPGFLCRESTSAVVYATRAEMSRIHPSYPVAAAAWSCLSSEKIRDQKNIHRNNLRQKTFPNDVGIAIPKNIQTRCRHGCMQ